MAFIENWNGEPVAVRYSKGGVLTLERWEDNVLGSAPWPNGLLRHVRGYVGQAGHFADEDAEALGAHLDGRISKFQSINSEDAVTYSWFGTLAAAAPSHRRAAVQWLYDRIGVSATAIAPVIDQWARVFHPNVPVSKRGPELDARIDDPDAALVYVEAKWSAAIGTGKGKNAGVPDDQVVLRRDSMRGDPALTDDPRALVVLGISEVTPDLNVWLEPAGSPRPIGVAWLTWDELAECSEHPRAAEFRLYLQWKRENAKTP